MTALTLEVVSGRQKGHSYTPDGDIVVLGRAAAADLQLEDDLVSSEHAQLVLTDEAAFLQDLGSTNGTVVLRNNECFPLESGREGRMRLQPNDVIRLGGEGTGAAELRVSVGEEVPEHVISVKPLGEIADHTASVERDATLLQMLSRAQKTIRSSELGTVLQAVADASLGVVTRATHATIILKQDLDEEGEASGYVPVMTRVRVGDSICAPDAPVPISRSIYRKVVRERAALLAANAPAESFSSESLLGANIRSTLAVPLWRSTEIIGVLQLDNRSATARFDATDLEALGVLATNASLAVDNARLIQRLTAAEQQLREENLFLRTREQRRRRATQVIGQSEAMRRVFDNLQRVASTRVSVLIEGETGTGKELVAAELHARSPRASKLFVAQNCAALPESLLESELFGHKRGAFTGATEDKRGLFQVADGGTLFLDEIGEMPMALQAKLLRVLQEGEVRPLGATVPKQVDVRIVAATNRSLEKEVSEGRFREDLYYRIKVFPIQLPPLRERPEDIPALAGHFLEVFSAEIGKPVAGFAQDALQALSAYEWPGNVRELQNEIQRLVIVADPGTFVVPELLSARIRKLHGLLAEVANPRGALKETMEQLEKYILLQALRDHGNNKTNTAKALGITREGLHKKLRQLGIQ